MQVDFIDGDQPRFDKFKQNSGRKDRGTAWTGDRTVNLNKRRCPGCSGNITKTIIPVDGGGG